MRELGLLLKAHVLIYECAALETRSIESSKTTFGVIGLCQGLRRWLAISRDRQRCELVLIKGYAFVSDQMKGQPAEGDRAENLNFITRRNPEAVPFPV